MGCYRELDKIPSVKNTILTIGTFDGLHLGHQKILNKITNESKELNLKSVLITFDPKPSSILFKMLIAAVIPGCLILRMHMLALALALAWLRSHAWRLASVSFKPAARVGLRSRQLKLSQLQSPK